MSLETLLAERAAFFPLLNENQHKLTQIKIIEENPHIHLEVFPVLLLGECLSIFKSQRENISEFIWKTKSEKSYNFLPPPGCFSNTQNVNG